MKRATDLGGIPVAKSPGASDRQCSVMKFALLRSDDAPLGNRSELRAEGRKARREMRSILIRERSSL
jgi:hypothetical protein